MKDLVVSRLAPELVEAATQRIDKHPSWCHREWCSADTARSGMHHSEPMEVRSERETEPSTIKVSLRASINGDAPLVFLEISYPADVNAYCGTDSEPEIAILSVRQAGLLAGVFSELLSPYQKCC